MHIVISEVMDADAVAFLEAKFDVHYDPTLMDDKARLYAAIADADALIVKNRVRVTPELLAAGPRLRVVGRLGTGLDTIDLPACKARNVAVHAAGGANARSVAEYVICTTFMLMKTGAYLTTAEVAAGQWPQVRVRDGREVDGKTIGLVGLGAIGQHIARMANGIGMKVLAYAPTKAPDDPVFAAVNAQRVDLDALLAQADVVSLQVPLTPDTRQMFSRERIAAMKKGAILINIARGAVVDNAALIDALKSGHLAGAALDVFETEPLPAGSVFAAPVPNLLLTPHIAGSTLESTERRGTLVAQRVADALHALQ